MKTLNQINEELIEQKLTVLKSLEKINFYENRLREIPRIPHTSPELREELRDYNEATLRKYYRMQKTGGYRD